MRETSTLEFKRTLSKTYLKTVSAFANYETGRILFGVDDDGTPCGVDALHDDCLRIEHAINDSIVPSPRFTLEVDDESQTITLTVFEGAAKPYLYQGKAYRRADSSTVEVDRLEYNRLARIGANTTFDALEASTQDLSFDTLQAACLATMQLDRLERDALISLELLSPSGVFDNAAALLSDNNPFPGIDIMRFGSSIDIILARHTLDHVSVISQMKHAVELFNEHYAYEEVIGASRVERHLIPLEAFREAIANAIVHRRWDVRASIKVSMFPDRIEITSPGGLPDGITEAEYLAGGPSVARNPILANVFFRLGYIERFGTGIPRIRRAYEHRPVPPRFVIREASIAVTLPTENAMSLSHDEQRVLDAFDDGRQLTRAEVTARTDFSKQKAVRLLNSLVEKGIVTKTGAGRAVQYARR